MTFFKINKNKNKTASAPSTPAQTPRASMQDAHPKSTKDTMTMEQTMELIYKNAYGGAMPMSGGVACSAPSII
ncbi:hypothetical protein DFQ27_003130 [Actinomortierella ambigua]|uniref:Uncharacterized protein n=1 Tax=Actinomortierella ambigua TaxID=1343610 RepID=A0A9P6Q7P5_9FUNG|nr:hypothetical protein DFQ27_003130 [Actinomortierella ambigua]